MQKGNEAESPPSGNKPEGKRGHGVVERSSREGGDAPREPGGGKRASCLGCDGYTARGQCQSWFPDTGKEY